MPAKGHRETPSEAQAAFNQYPDALYPVSINDKWGYINRKGDRIIPPMYETADDFINGIASVSSRNGDQTLSGFIDVKGNWVVQPMYQRTGQFSEGLCAVQKDNFFGYINLKGEEVIPCKYEAAGPFTSGRAAVKINGWVGFIDTSGKMVIEPQFTCAVSHPRFVEGMAPVFGADEKTGYIDTSGMWRIEKKFHSASIFTDGLAWTMIEKEDPDSQYGFTIRGGYIDTSGEYVIQPEYDFGWDFSEGYATVWKLSADRRTKIWRIINPQGEIILDNIIYRNVGAMSNGLIPIQDEKMNWGFMNIKGEIVIAPQYAGINHFKNGLARMEIGSAFNNRPVYITTEGKIAWEE